MRNLILPESKSRFLFAAFSIMVLGFALRTFQLASQPVSFDDFDVAISAINYTESGQLGPTMWNHPDLRNLLVYAAMKLFGTGVVGVKGISVLLGTLSVLLLALVSRRIFSDGRVALVAACLFALDPLAIDFSRQAINDIYLAFFPLAGIYFFYRFRDSGRRAWLIGSGVLFGCGLASKWSVLFPLAVTFVLAIRMIAIETKNRVAERTARIAEAASVLIVLPVLVYLMTFIPWFSRGYSLAEWMSLQKSMFVETSQHTGYTPDAMVDKDIRAYEWFIRPVTFRDVMFNIDNDQQLNLSTENNATILLALTNPFVWLLVLPAAAYAAYRAVHDRSESLAAATAFFLCSYVPLVITRRPIWLNTALSVLPFALMLVAFFVLAMAEKFKKRDRIVAVYLTLVVIATPPLYLLAIGKGLRMPVAGDYLKKRYLSGSAPGNHSEGTPEPGRQ